MSLFQGPSAEGAHPRGIWAFLSNCQVLCKWLNEFYLLFLWVWNRNILSVLFILSEAGVWGQQVDKLVIPNLGAASGKIVLLPSCALSTFLAPLQPALSTSTFPLLPSSLTSSALTLSFKYPASLFFHPQGLSAF